MPPIDMTITMRRILSLIFPLAVAGALQASPMLSFQLLPGNLYNSPGGTSGWGFTLTSDSTDWISVLTSSLTNESNPALGIYNDFIGLQGGPVNSVLGPNASWTETFDLGAQTGVGSYSIGPAAPIDAAADVGILDVQYQIFSGDPNACGSCSIGFGDIAAPFSIHVTAAPEPRTLGWLSGFVIFALLSRRRGYQQPRNLSRQD